MMNRPMRKKFRGRSIGPATAGFAISTPGIESDVLSYRHRMMLSQHTIDDGGGIVYALGSKPLHVLIDLGGQSAEFIHANP
ncbi:MAG: hypothetical protein K9J77_12125 [Rhodoferax sp.]|nr:hypothetical protein [Rhodoferax sp.]